MIRAPRAREPGSWAALAASELRRVQAALRAGAPLSKDLLGSEYKRARSYLRRAQRYKCCYCELLTQEKHEPVEHYRPKLRAIRSTGRSEPGYWWLTWTWHNLVFSCTNCNHCKHDHFPHTGSALTPGQLPPGREQPLLIDPVAEDGSTMIQFLPVRTRGRQQWRPGARAGSRRGLETIRILGLDRDELVDLYTAWAANIERDLKPVRDAIRDGDRVKVRDEWSRLLRRYYHASQSFTQLSFDVLDHLVPATERSTWRLAMPKRPYLR